MEKNFDFDRIGKRMPYTTPTGFFDQMEDNVWKEIQREEAVRRHKRKLFRLRSIIGMTAVAASIALLLVFHPGRQDSGLLQVEQAFANLSNEDQTYMLEVYQDDIFIIE
ncbi:MAG: hypothetical protein Q4D56_12590 [Bacteroides sp.]|nr:hypothetical protein [Bacteroides sp.]